MIYIGWDPREVLAYEVCRASLLAHSSLEVQPQPLVLHDCVARGLYARPIERRGAGLWDPVSGAPMATEFALTRFLLPWLGSHPWALFCDADFLWRADVAELWALRDERYAIMCVQHDHQPAERTKMDGQIQTQYPRKNWSSLMLVHCAHPAHQTLDLARFNATPGRDLHRFCWLDDALVGAIPPVWNWLEGSSPAELDPKAVHFTRGGPWLPDYQHVPYADAWREVAARVKASPAQP